MDDVALTQLLCYKTINFDMGNGNELLRDGLLKIYRNRFNMKFELKIAEAN